jgi:hypothetical protein
MGYSRNAALMLHVECGLDRGASQEARLVARTFLGGNVTTV